MKQRKTNAPFFGHFDPDKSVTYSSQYVTLTAIETTIIVDKRTFKVETLGNEQHDV